MPALIASGTQTATIGTEHSLNTDTTNRVYIFVVDTVNMVNADELELRINTIVLTGGTARLAYIASYSHVQSAPIKFSVPVPADISIEITLKQTAGTGRSYPWALLAV